MKVTIQFEAEAENTNDLKTQIQAWLGQAEATDTPSPRRGKKLAAATNDDADDSSEDQEEFSIDEEQSEEDEDSNGETEYEMSDVTRALKGLPKQKAFAILKKFKVKGVKQLKPKQFSAVMKAASA